MNSETIFVFKPNQKMVILSEKVFPLLTSYITQGLKSRVSSSVVQKTSKTLLASAQNKGPLERLTCLSNPNKKPEEKENTSVTEPCILNSKGNIIMASKTEKRVGTLGFL